jgi:hypothetical protein
MIVDDPDFLDLRSVTAANLNAALGCVRGYLKFASILWIRALGEPTLDGIIVRRWSRNTAGVLRRFCAPFASQEFLLRIDKHLTRWSERRGGYLIRATDAGRVARELSRENMITAMLEPASPHRDLYCLSCVTIPQQNKIVVEVVGPGFDTSDLVRSDLLPHERFEVSARLDQLSIGLAAGFLPQRTYRITQENYRRSVEERLVKIGARLRKPAFPKAVLAEGDELQEDARRFLRKSRETLLLRHAKRYEPIPRKYLLRFLSGVVRMLSGLERCEIRLGAVTFSGTFTARRRFVYWDFFPADTSRADLLYSLRRS